MNIKILPAVFVNLSNPSEKNSVEISFETLSPAVLNTVVE